MRRHADRQPDRFAGTGRQRFLRHPRHILIPSGNHDLRFCIEVGNISIAVDQQLLQPAERQSGNCGQAVALRIGLLHQIAAQSHQP